MPATLDRSDEYSLWLSCTLPSPRPTWEPMATGTREELEETKARLMPFAAKKKFAIVPGTDPPRWEPKL
jgi:hypothetical protein